MRTISGFVSHIFDDQYYQGGTRAFREAITTLFGLVSQRLSSDGDSVELEAHFIATDYERSLPSQLRQSIVDSDFVIADITTASPNVLYEIGYASALNIPILIIANQSRGLPPCDIRDMLVGFYEAPSDLPERLAPSIARILTHGIQPSPHNRNSIAASVRKIWFEDDAREIHIICTPEPERSRFASRTEPNYLFLDNLEDRDALLEVSMFLSRQYPQACIFKHSSDTVGPDVLSENVVILGGPGDNDGSGNQIARELMSSLGSRILYSQGLTAMEFGEPALTLEAELRADGSVARDWGMLLAAPNPSNPFHRVVLCNGIYTYGTMAAVGVLSDAPGALTNHLLLKENFKLDDNQSHLAFELACSVSVVAGGRISFPRLRPHLIRRLA
jgi:hypothetical protein